MLFYLIIMYLLRETFAVTITMSDGSLYVPTTPIPHRTSEEMEKERGARETAELNVRGECMRRVGRARLVVRKRMAEMEERCERILREMKDVMTYTIRSVEEEVRDCEKDVWIPPRQYTEIVNRSTNESVDGNNVTTLKRNLMAANIEVEQEIDSDEEVTITRRATKVIKRSEEEKDLLIVCGKSVLLFAGEENEQVRQDVINSMILAQLAADKAVINYKQQHGTGVTVLDELKCFFDTFVQVYLHMNWVNTGYDVQEAKVSGNDLSVDKVLIEIVDAIGNEEEKSKLKKAIKALSLLPTEDERIKLWRKSTIEAGKGQFLVHVCTIDARGSATMKTSMIGVSTKRDITDVLFFKWRQDEASVYKAEHTMMLGGHSIDNMREVIQAKIQQVNKTFIQSIPF